MPLSPNPTHSTWETIDLDTIPTRYPPRGSPYHTEPDTPYQPLLHSRHSHPIDIHQSPESSFTQVPIFPLPTPPPYQEYHTFPPPPPTQSGDSDDDETCYFDTLDFSDYLLPRDEKYHSQDHTSQHRRQQRGWGQQPTHGAATLLPVPLLHTIYRAIAARSGHVESEIAIRRRGPGSGSGRGWRGWQAVRDAVVVGIVVLLLVLLVGLAIGVVGKGGAAVSAANVGDDWGLCTAARPRFCRLVVGEGAGR